MLTSACTFQHYIDKGGLPLKESHFVHILESYLTCHIQKIHVLFLNYQTLQDPSYEIHWCQAASDSMIVDPTHIKIQVSFLNDIKRYTCRFARIKKQVF